MLRLTRPIITQCPSPPTALSDWLKSSWQEISGKVEVHPTRNGIGKDGKTLIEKFETDFRRPSLLRAWQQQRDQWVTNERPARQSMALFQTVYEWYGIQEREGERVELLVGDGLLSCPDGSGAFSHPILLQKLELEFYPEKRQPQFVLRKREQPPELYMEFLRALPGVDSKQLARCVDEIKKAEFAPLGAEDTDGFLRRLISQQLIEVTSHLVEKQTWMNQVRQTGGTQRQALGAYAAMRNKLTKTGRGVRDAELRAAARREMATAKDAVPVWIMPLAEVADTFDPRKTRFDVVIIDEASQCDPTSLFALYLGHQTIIVGDDEQVTPVAAGVDMGEVSKLIRLFLEGVPFKELYDGTTSVYDLAQIAFGSVIRLIEHFRCAPNIIAFSNNLSYKGEIN